MPFFLGLASSFSLPPYNLLIINFITFPLLLLVISENSKGTKWIFFKIGWFFGFGYFVSNLYWITYSLTFEESFKFLIPIALIIIPLFLGLFYGFAILILSFFKLEKNFFLVLLFSLVLAIFEFIRGSILSGFPWNLIVFSWSNYINSLQILSLIGTYSFNLISITFFSFPFLIFIKKNLKFRVITTFSLLLILVLNNIYGSWVIKKDNNELRSLEYKVKILSPKIKIERFLEFGDPEKTIKELINLSEPNKSEKTIFIYPEGILTNIYFEDLKLYKNNFVENFSSDHTIFMGVNSRKLINRKNKIYNSLVVMDNELNLIAKYDKNNLVPFGEFLPFENFFSKFGLKKITSGYESFSAGKKRNLISLNKTNFLPLICYEIIYSGNLKQKFVFTPPNAIDENFDFIVNISEDGWFGNSVGQYQHFSHSIFRSVEEGKNLIRSANNGITAFINSKGKVISQIESTRKGFIEVRSFQTTKKTHFSFYGNKIFFYFLIFYTILFFFLKIREKQ